MDGEWQFWSILALRCFSQFKSRHIFLHLLRPLLPVFRRPTAVVGRMKRFSVTVHNDGAIVTQGALQVRILLVWLERHRVKAVTTGQLRELCDAQAFLKGVLTRAVEHFFREPSPNTLPCSVWVNLSRVQYHGKTCWPAVGRVLLRDVLLSQSEVVLCSVSHERMLEDLLSHGRGEGYYVLR